MKCLLHPDKEAISTCKNCGSALCEECDTANHCYTCAASNDNSKQPASQHAAPAKPMPEWAKFLIGCLVVIGAIVLLLLSTCAILIHSL